MPKNILFDEERFREAQQWAKDLVETLAVQWRGINILNMLEHDITRILLKEMER